MTLRLRAVLFDLDGTLHDKPATLRVMARRQHAAHAPAVDPAQWERAYLALNEMRIEKAEVFSRLRERFRLRAEVADTLRHEFDTTLGAHAQACDGALGFVDACRAAGLRTGIVTNGRDAFQRSKIEGLGLRVDAIVTSGAFGVKKPDPAIFEACLRQLGVRAEEAAFVGDDYEADMRPARALGMRTCWKSAGACDEVDLAAPHLSVLHQRLLGP